MYRYRLLNDRWRASAAGFGGILQGLVGFSAGELSTVEQVLRGMPVRIAAGNSHMIIFAAATAAAFTHLSVSAAQGTTIPWNIIAACAPAVLIGGQFAGMLAGRIPQEILRMVLAGFLTFIGLISAYRASMGTRLHIPVWVLVVSVVVCLTAIILVITRQNRKRAGLKACEAAAGSCCSCVPRQTELTEPPVAPSNACQAFKKSLLRSMVRRCRRTPLKSACSLLAASRAKWRWFTLWNWR